MYFLAVANGHTDLGERISRHLLSNGVPFLSRHDGVDIEKAKAHKPDRQVGSGERWVLWHEPPFGDAVEPPPELVLAWAEDIAETENAASPHA